MNEMKSSSPINILFVVNDHVLEDLVRRTILSIHKSHQFHISFVKSGSGAISALKHNISFDIVYTELNLPEMNGLALLRNLEENHPRINTVLLSHRDDYNTIRAALNRGAFDFLLLPLDLSDFEKTLSNVLEETLDLREADSSQKKLLALEQELDIARQIQTTVISNRDSNVNNDDRIAIGGHSLPAHQVGGDFYDYFFLDKNRLGFVIGDVASKGLPAALFMATSRTLIRSFAFQGYPPDLCLKEVNKVLVRESDPSLFIAVFYGILDLVTGEVTYSNGGHTFPYCKNSQDEIKHLNEPGSMVLGVVEDAEFILQSLYMSVGDIILLYTDGFISMMNNSDIKPFDDIIKMVLLNKKSQNLQKTIFNLFEEIIDGVYPDSEQDDDLTIFALNYKG